jgi:hypothetical protein
MRLQVIGATRLANKIQAAAQAGPQAVGMALYQEAEAIMTASKETYVPVDTGALRASGRVEPPIALGAVLAVTMGFGGPSAPYAVIVHEDLTKRHPVGQAKYLEIPLRARLAGMPSVLAMRARNGIQQAFQRLGNVETNVLAGRAPYWGMPLFRGGA